MTTVPTTRKVAPGAVLDAVPAEMRAPILSGMRWTLWLSVLSIPFSYGTNLVLARISPEALGSYGVLSVYIAAVAVFLYLGGNAVAIRFLPGLKVEERLPFVRAYLYILFLGWLPWVAIAALWPGKLHYLFGTNTSARFQLLLMCVAPLYLLFYLGLASLKGLLRIKWAQMLDRMLTIGSFFIYAAFWIFAPAFVARRYALIVWTVYLGLVALGAVLAWAVLLRLPEMKAPPQPKSFKLPAGFWRYTGSLQASSVLGFFSTRLDYILILNVGGLAQLGKYVAILATAGIIPKIVAFFLDSLLPALTNTLAEGHTESAVSVTHTYVRIILPLITACSLGVLLFAHPLLALMGSKYSDLVPLLQLSAPIAAVQSLNWLTGTLFSGTGHPQYEAVAKVFRTALLAGTLIPLWHRYGLLGAIICWGICEFSYHILSIVFLWRTKSLLFHPGREYAVLALVLAIGGYVAWLGHSIGVGAVTWAILLSIYLVLDRFTSAEIRGLTHIVLPVAPKRANVND